MVNPNCIPGRGFVAYDLQSKALIEKRLRVIAADYSPKTPFATAILTRDIVQLRRNSYRRNLRDTAQCL
jgi:hypothetical protein